MATDASTGATYYYNSKTGETSWTLCESMMMVSSSAEDDEGRKEGEAGEASAVATATTTVS